MFQLQLRELFFQSVMLRMVQCKYDHTDLESDEDLSIAPLPIVNLSLNVLWYTHVMLLTTIIPCEEV